MKQPNTVYLAGPMTGYPQFNIPMFERSARILRGQGYTVICPPELDTEATYTAAMKSQTGSPYKGKVGDETWGQMLGRDISQVTDKADAVVFLPGWANSKGAILEAFTALITGKDFYIFDISEKICIPIRSVDVSIAVKRYLLRCV